MPHPFIKNITFHPAPVSPAWPTRADGTNKTMGEMTKEERREQVKASIERTKYELLSVSESALH